MQTESKTRLALCILAVAAAMGLLADAFLRTTPWGINLTLWIVFLSAGLFFAKSAGGGTLRLGSVFLMAPIVVFGFCFAWRDSAFLQGLDLFAIILAAALVMTRQAAAFWAPTLGTLARSLFEFIGHCAAGFVHLIARDIDWSGQRSAAVSANAKSAAAGILIALPLLAIFTLLFVRADAAFESFYYSALNIPVASHAVSIGLGAWMAGSYLRGVLVPSFVPEKPPTISKLQLGPTEINVALGLLNLLFATFVAVQLQYLFGNAKHVETTPGLTFSSYARRGFFELCTVALLVLPILLAADTLHTREKSKRFFRLQSCALTIFVLAIMASALHRMGLYQHEYGLTELRWYTVAFMLWLAVVFALFCGTVLRNVGGLFIPSVLASGFAAIFILHAVNPDRWIAETNLNNARAGRRFDAEYLRVLSADAAPIVLANSNLIPSTELENFIARQKQDLAESTDPRSWNYSRAQAAAALK